MIPGITPQEEKIIQVLLKKYKGTYDFFYYGSRVKGNFSKVSDLDILIKGTQEMPVETLRDLKQAFDASPLPYVVNFSDFCTIDPPFYALIQADLVPVF